MRTRGRGVLLAAGAMCGLAAVVGFQRGEKPRAPGDSPSERSSSIVPARVSVDELTLGQQVGQLLVLRFAGTSAPGYVVSVFRDRRAAGAILFGDNITAPSQLRALTRALRRQGGRPIIAVDQEGGTVRRVPWAPPAASASEQAAAGTVRSDSRAAARALRSLGITVSLAPVGDVPSVPDAAIGERAFSRDPPEVSAAMEEAVAGWRAGGVAPTAKHFPGLGGAATNTDHATVTIARSREALERTDFPPFEAAITAVCHS